MGEYFNYIGTAVGAAVVTGAATAAFVHMACTPSPMVQPVDLNNQSIEIPNSGGVRQSHFAPLGETTGFIYDDAKTLLEVMARGARISNNGPCLGWRGEKPEYHWIPYNDVIERARNLASGLMNIGMKSGQSTFIGIYAQNCVEWILTEHACYNQSAVTVPLYDTLVPHACSFIINEAEISIVACDTEEKVKSLLAEAAQTPFLKQIVVIKEFSEEVKRQAEDVNICLHLFKDIETLGKEKPVPTNPCKPEDLSTVCYTSGTTGNPKGVMLTHANIVIDTSALVLQFGEHAAHYPDIMSSFLPLAHMLERLSQTTLYINGGAVGFYRGDIRLLMDDLVAMKPTVTPVVPRLLNKIYDKVQAQINDNKFKRLLFNLALRSKRAEVERCVLRNNSIWDKLVFKKIRDGMGGNLRLLVCGSAPLAENVMTFMRCAMGCIVVEGYGQTECVAPCTVNIKGDYSIGQVGPPLPCCHMKLVDVPEMEYYSAKSQGEASRKQLTEYGTQKLLTKLSEVLVGVYLDGKTGYQTICIKGGHVFKGYFKDPVKTAETIDEDGWLHTGDIGMWLPNGALKIIDRKKHIFKLSQGEYIVPEKIENIYLASPYVGQIFVHGESLQSCLVAVIAPAKEVLEPWCQEKGIEGSWKQLCENEAVKSAILADINLHGKKAGLKSFEQVKDIYLHPELFSIDSGLLTPTLKTKRPECRRYFMKQIEAMYQLLA